MSADYDLMRLWDSTHESGHLCASLAVGFTPGAATLNPDGRQFTGCMFWSAPGVDADLVRQVRGSDGLFWTWPGEVKQRIEGEVIVAMAGELAVDLFAGVHVEPAEENNVTSADVNLLSPRDLPEPTAEELARIAAHENDLVFPTDAMQIDRLCRVAHGTDVESARAWRSYLDATCRALLLRHEERVRWLALVLAEEGTLSAAAVARLVAGP